MYAICAVFLKSKFEDLLRGRIRDLKEIGDLQDCGVHLDVAVFVLGVIDQRDDFVGLAEDADIVVKAHERPFIDFHLLFDVLQAKDDVLIDGHVRPKSIVLEQEADLALGSGNVDARLRIENDGVADGDAAASGCL